MAKMSQMKLFRKYDEQLEEVLANLRKEVKSDPDVMLAVVEHLSRSLSYEFFILGRDAGAADFQYELEQKSKSVAAGSGK
jgi:hypothetical protein